MNQDREWPLYLGVILTSLSVLTLEIALTRIFSVSLWYHLAFMIISTALLGFGASGALLAVWRNALKGDIERKLAWYAIGFSLSLLLSFALMVRIPLDPLAPINPTTANRTVALLQLAGYMLLYYVLIVLPFVFAGLTLGTALSARARAISSLYFADLIGAGLGCLAVVLALYRLPGQSVVVLAAVGSALAGISFLWGDRPIPSVASVAGRLLPLSQRALGILSLLIYVSLLVLLILPWAEDLFQLYIPPSKPLHLAYDTSSGVTLEYTGWNPFSRIDVMGSPEMGGLAWGLSGAFQGKTVPQKFVTVDAAAITPINRWTGNLEEVAFVNYTPASLAYRLVERPKVLIIGPGGGIDVLTALYNGARHITAVEINPLIVNELMRDRYRDYSGGLYTDYDQVEVHVAEGRNFVARSREQYDVIQFSQVDTWAAASSGAYSLSENYLYTLEAFHDYMDHLTPNGILTVGRWYLEPPAQAMRLVTIGATALMQRGVADPADHFIVVRAGDTSTLLMKMSPFTAEEVQRMRAIIEPLYFSFLYAPGISDADPRFVAFFQAQDKRQFYHSYPLDVTPTTDDRPFFFENYGWTNFGTFRSGKLTLTILLVQALLLASLLILWPLWRYRRTGLSARGARRFLIYFAALGVGFIFIELGLMQRFILFLGHPTYSLSVVLFSLLTFSGIGSFASRRWGESPREGQRLVIPLLALLVLLYIFVLPPLFRAWLAWPLVGRIAVSIALLAPLGLLMGMPFPLGIRLVDRTNQLLIPWAWGVNGFASVVGSVLSIMLAQSYGFGVVMGLALLIYLAGLAAVQIRGS